MPHTTTAAAGICLCSTTDDGHCAIAGRDHRIDLDATLAALEEMTLRVARAGAYLPPSAYEVGFVSLAHDDAILEEAAAALIEAAAEVDRS